LRKRRVVQAAVVFDQVYFDGATTTWRARYHLTLDMLVEGLWTGECEGTFQARRRSSSGCGSPLLPPTKAEDTPERPGSRAAAADTKDGADGGSDGGQAGRWYRVRSRCAVTAECVISNPQTVAIVHEYAIGTRLWVQEIRDGTPPAVAVAPDKEQSSDQATNMAEVGDGRDGGERTSDSGGGSGSCGGGGKLRARTDEGWVSLVANDGTVLLVACGSKSDLEEQRDKEELGEWF